MTNTVFLTGATGYIGSSLLNHLSSKGLKIFALSRAKKEPLGLNITYIQGDLTNKPDFSSSLNSSGTLIHMASIASYCPSKYHTQFDLNVNGTSNLLGLIKESTNIKKIIYISTANIDGFHDKSMRNCEELKDIGYISTKTQAEELIKNYCLKHKIKFTILRPATVYGVNSLEQSSKNFIKQLIVKKNKIWPCPSGGTSIINIKSLVRFIYNSIHLENYANKTITVCEHKISYFDLFKNIALLSESNPLIIKIPSIAFTGFNILPKRFIKKLNIDMYKIAPHFPLSTSKDFKRFLNEEEIIPLDQTIRESLKSLSLS